MTEELEKKKYIVGTDVFVEFKLPDGTMQKYNGSIDSISFSHDNDLYLGESPLKEFLPSLRNFSSSVAYVNEFWKDEVGIFNNSLKSILLEQILYDKPIKWKMVPGFYGSRICEFSITTTTKGSMWKQSRKRFSYFIPLEQCIHQSLPTASKKQVQRIKHILKQRKVVIDEWTMNKNRKRWRIIDYK